jgi:hypothetical protein
LYLQKYLPNPEAVMNSAQLKLADDYSTIEAMPPGFSPIRMVSLMKRSIAATKLDLSSVNILTEAASGAYGATPVIAALAGAQQVYALVRPSRYGSVSQIREWIGELASEAGVTDRIELIEDISTDLVGKVDIVTNSGHLRPITADLIDYLPASAVIALMFEAWELRTGDIDLDACSRRGIPIVGINERHPQIDVFSFLGPLCVKELHDSGIPVCRDTIALVCDNDFSEYIASGLRAQGSHVEIFADAQAVYSHEWDAVVIALHPQPHARIGQAECRHLASMLPKSAVTVQFWGDVDRDAATAHGMMVWPPQPPSAGHMAVLLSDIGPEPVVRLQTGGLRAAEWIWRGNAEIEDGFAQVVKNP